MKQKPMKKLLALLLVMAMALSMVTGAFAVGPESATAETNVVKEEAADTLGVDDDDVQLVDADALTEEAMTEALVEAENEMEAEAPVEEEPVEEAPVQEAQEEAPVQEEEPVSLETQADGDEEGPLTPVWTIVENGDSKDYSLTLSGESVQGYYVLPELKDETETVTFSAGVYFFDENGKWDCVNNGLEQDEVCENIEYQNADTLGKQAKVRQLTATEKEGVVSYEVKDLGEEIWMVVGQIDTETDVKTNTWTLFSGCSNLNKLYYYQGVLYNGFLRLTAQGNKRTYLLTNGKHAWFTGCMTDKAYANLPLIDNYQEIKKDSKFYAGGMLDGYVKQSNGKIYAVISGKLQSSPLYGTMNSSLYCAQGIGGTSAVRGDGKAYFDGKLFTGYYFNSKLYTFSKGVRKDVFTGTVPSSATTWVNNNGKMTYKSKAYSGKYLVKGQLFTGLHTNRYYYEKGVKKADKRGWLKIKSGNIYLLYYMGNDGKAYTGWHVISRSGVKYKYYFRSTKEKNPCAVVTDMFAYNAAYKQKKLEVRISRSSDTVSILYYDSKAKAYIPCKSFVVAMSKVVTDTKPGVYKLRKKKGWHQFKFEDGSIHYYLYPTLILGSGSLFHSVDYAIEGDRESLMNRIYNQLGRNVTHFCVRTQCSNSKLIYNLVRMNSNIKVYITTSSKVKQYLPFGKMTLDYNFDYVGQLYCPKRGTRGFDPTDTAIKGKKPKMA